MKPLHSAPLFVAALALIAFGRCDSGGDGSTPVLDVILTIGDSWENQADASHFFVFVADGDDGTLAGTFTGTEFRGTEENDLAGQWDHGRVEFTVQRPSGAVTYEAFFDEDNPSVLAFDSSEGSLVLAQSS